MSYTSRLVGFASAGKRPPGCFRLHVELSKLASTGLGAVCRQRVEVVQEALPLRHALAAQRAQLSDLRFHCFYALAIRVQFGLREQLLDRGDPRVARFDVALDPSDARLQLRAHA